MINDFLRKSQIAISKSVVLLCCTSQDILHFINTTFSFILFSKVFFVINITKSHFIVSDTLSPLLGHSFAYCALLLVVTSYLYRFMHALVLLCFKKDQMPGLWCIPFQEVLCRITLIKRRYFRRYTNKKLMPNL